jgi:predicted nucleotidyltransferase component of viral defense system
LIIRGARDRFPALAQTSPLSDTFCLKGGTALRLIYFDDWRHSVDLDVSVLPAFPSAELRKHVERWFAAGRGYNTS